MYNIYAIVILILFDIPRISVNDLHQIQVAAPSPSSRKSICAGNRLKLTESITSSVNPSEIATGDEIFDESRYSLNTEPAGNYSLIATSPEVKVADSTDAPTDRFKLIMEMQKLLYLIRHTFNFTLMYRSYLVGYCLFPSY